MSAANFENKQTLDQVIGDIREEPVDPAIVEAAAGRVWSSISSARGPRLVEKIRSCEDYQALLDDYRTGRLSEARRLLVEDHTHECVACRKALHGPAEPAPRHITVKPAVQPYTRWAIAAAVVIGFGLTTLGVVYYVDA